MKPLGRWAWMFYLLPTRFISIGLVFKGLEMTLKWGPGESNWDATGGYM